MTDIQIKNWKHFMNDQIEEIKKHNWIESEKAGRDVSCVSNYEWINKYAKKFKDEWLLNHPDENFL